ncbi:MAG: hypothetical protein HC874_14265 [Richelia sp. SL_2_1]|nr:hypothetical protein [Richelia sp. SL_2_1]
MSKEPELNLDSSINNILRMRYKSDDPTVQNIEGQVELNLYSGQYAFPDGRYQDGTTSNDTDFFAKTLHLLDIGIRNASSTVIPQVPLIYPEDYRTDKTVEETDYNFEPRLLWWAGRRIGVDGYVNLDGTTAYDFPASFMVNYNDPLGEDPSLSFGNEVLLSGVKVDGIIRRFHLQHLKRLQIGKRLTEWIRWKALEITNLKFSRKIVIDGVKFILQKIDGFKPAGQKMDSVKTALLLDDIPTAEDAARLTTSGFNGYIQNI